mmetsp:Transcript_129333/g.241935  ORF Transcript_129333/g.241935 Transcript_129333/m.241935 type:complete len:442 (-) Transcript_129333:341-1666(-)
MDIFVRILAALITLFSAQSGGAMIITHRPSIEPQALIRSRAVPLSQGSGLGQCGQSCRSLLGLLKAQQATVMPPRVAKVAMLADYEDPGKAKKKDRAMQGPVLFSWASGALTLGLQAQFTDWQQLKQDAEFVSDFIHGNLLGNSFWDGSAVPEIYVLLYMVVIGSSFAFFPNAWPAQTKENAQGRRIPMEVPHRHKNMKQHKLTSVDHSYMILNSLCMPGLFYHFITLMRSWGLDLSAPPLFGIYPPSVDQLISETVPELVGSLTLYMLTYEFVYYWWHRSMHEIPTLYKWVHKHHHKQTYPDRAAIDTLNTGCFESQAGLYMQLAVLWLCGKSLGVASLPGACWFFTIAGWLSVIEHDKFERALPLDLFRADEHHMHHAFVRCNYCPYSTVWDRVFGTYKPFEVMQSKQNDDDRAGLDSDPLPTNVTSLPHHKQQQGLAV